MALLSPAFEEGNTVLMNRAWTELRSLAVTLALSAMVLRALLPEGWMPNTFGVPGTSLVICSVDGVHHRPQTPSGKPDADHGMVCPFAAMAHLARPQSPIAVPRPALVAQIAPRHDRQASVSDPPALEHGARGPPASL